MCDKKERIERINYQVEQKKLFAQYWMTMAQCQALTDEPLRDLFHGTETTEENKFTKEELIKEALNTSLNHIHQIEEYEENKIELMKELQ